MSFTDRFRKSPYRLVYEKDAEGANGSLRLFPKHRERLRLFIDQRSDNPNGQQVAGVLLDFSRTESGGSYKIFLEPSGNIDSLRSSLGNCALYDSQVVPNCDVLPDAARAIYGCRIEKDWISNSGVQADRRKAAAENPGYAYDTGLVECSVREEYEPPLLEILTQDGFISETTAKALKTTIETFEASDPSKKFNTRPLESQLAQIVPITSKGSSTPGRT